MKDPSYLNQTLPPRTSDHQTPTSSKNRPEQQFSLKKEWKESSKWIKILLSILLIGGFVILIVIGLADSSKKIRKASDDFDKERTEQKATSVNLLDSIP